MCELLQVILLHERYANENLKKTEPEYFTKHTVSAQDEKLSRDLLYEENMLN